MADVTAHRPLEHFQKGELMLELRCVKVASWICLNCGYHLDGSGAWPALTAESRAYWTSGSRSARSWPSLLGSKGRVGKPPQDTVAGTCRVNGFPVAD